MYANCYEFHSAQTRAQVELVAAYYQTPPCLIDGASNETSWSLSNMNCEEL